MADGVLELIAQEASARADAVAAASRLSEIHAQIEQLAVADDRAARQDPLYRKMTTAHSGFIIRLRRTKRAVSSALGALQSVSVPDYTRPEDQIAARNKEIERVAARREQQAARRAAIAAQQEDMNA